ncbi:MAG: AAA domain-containing protein, partial [Candidatus Omnitrophica bacterium]|nr:AAA domain-containing protein [Candidatus Omnitrophota bacterium]
ATTDRTGQPVTLKKLITKNDAGEIEIVPLSDSQEKDLFGEKEVSAQRDRVSISFSQSKIPPLIQETVERIKTHFTGRLGEVDTAIITENFMAVARRNNVTDVPGPIPENVIRPIADALRAAQSPQTPPTPVTAPGPVQAEGIYEHVKAGQEGLHEKAGAKVADTLKEASTTATGAGEGPLTPVGITGNLISAFITALPACIFGAVAYYCRNTAPSSVFIFSVVATILALKACRHAYLSYALSQAFKRAPMNEESGFAATTDDITIYVNAPVFDNLNTWCKREVLDHEQTHVLLNRVRFLSPRWRAILGEFFAYAAPWLGRFAPRFKIVGLKVRDLTPILDKAILENMQPFKTRHIVLPDLHGITPSLLKTMLMNARFIDENNRIIAKNTTLVVPGDITDRGYHSLALLRYMIMLKLRADRSFNKLGSKVVYLLGNHELMIYSGFKGISEDPGNADQNLADWIRNRGLDGDINAERLYAIIRTARPQDISQLYDFIRGKETFIDFDSQIAPLAYAKTGEKICNNAEEWYRICQEMDEWRALYMIIDNAVENGFIQLAYADPTAKKSGVLFVHGEFRPTSSDFDLDALESVTVLNMIWAEYVKKLAGNPYDRMFDAYFHVIREVVWHQYNEQTTGDGLNFFQVVSHVDNNFIAANPKAVCANRSFSYGGYAYLDIQDKKFAAVESLNTLSDGERAIISYEIRLNRLFIQSRLEPVEAYKVEGAVGELEGIIENPRTVLSAEKAADLLSTVKILCAREEALIAPRRTLINDHIAAIEKAIGTLRTISALTDAFRKNGVSADTLELFVHAVSSPDFIALREDLNEVAKARPAIYKAFNDTVKGADASRFTAADWTQHIRLLDSVIDRYHALREKDQKRLTSGLTIPVSFFEIIRRSAIGKVCVFVILNISLATIITALGLPGNEFGRILLTSMIFTMLGMASSSDNGPLMPLDLVDRIPPVHHNIWSSVFRWFVGEKRVYPKEHAQTVTKLVSDVAMNDTEAFTTDINYEDENLLVATRKRGGDVRERVEGIILGPDVAKGFLELRYQYEQVVTDHKGRRIKVVVLCYAPVKAIQLDKEVIQVHVEKAQTQLRHDVNFRGKGSIPNWTTSGLFAELTLTDEYRAIPEPENIEQLPANLAETETIFDRLIYAYSIMMANAQGLEDANLAAPGFSELSGLIRHFFRLRAGNTVEGFRQLIKLLKDEIRTTEERIAESTRAIREKEEARIHASDQNLIDSHISAIVHNKNNDEMALDKLYEFWYYLQNPRGNYFAASMNITPAGPADPKTPLVLFVNTLSPTQLDYLTQHYNIAALATTNATITSHWVVAAKNRGIPVVILERHTGVLKAFSSDIVPGAKQMNKRMVILRSDSYGNVEVVLGPELSTAEAFLDTVLKETALEDLADAELTHAPQGKEPDASSVENEDMGAKLSLLINAETADAIQASREKNHTRGAGLVRTEFFFMKKGDNDRDTEAMFYDILSGLEYIFAHNHALPDAASSLGKSYQKSRALLKEKMKNEFLRMSDAAGLKNPVTLRTIDFQPDKQTVLHKLLEKDGFKQRFMKLPSFQGIKDLGTGAEFYKNSLGNEILILQLEAIIEAAIAGATNLKVMFPMVSDVETLQTVITTFGVTRAEVLMRLAAENKDATAAMHSQWRQTAFNIQRGIMIETDEAVRNINQLLRVGNINFISIGTNDLSRYVMAYEKYKREHEGREPPANLRLDPLDRDKPENAIYLSTIQPAVLQMIVTVLAAADTYNRSQPPHKRKQISICGEMASWYEFQVVLMRKIKKLGIDTNILPISLSMSGTRVPLVNLFLKHIKDEYYAGIDTLLQESEDEAGPVPIDEKTDAVTQKVFAALFNENNEYGENGRMFYHKLKDALAAKTKAELQKPTVKERTRFTLRLLLLNNGYLPLGLPTAITGDFPVPPSPKAEKERAFAIKSNQRKIRDYAQRVSQENYAGKPVLSRTFEIKSPAGLHQRPIGPDVSTNAGTLIDLAEKYDVLAKVTKVRLPNESAYRDCDMVIERMNANALISVIPGEALDPGSLMVIEVQGDHARQFLDALTDPVEGIHDVQKGTDYMFFKIAEQQYSPASLSWIGKLLGFRYAWWFHAWTLEELFKVGIPELLTHSGLLHTDVVTSFGCFSFSSLGIASFIFGIFFVVLHAFNTLPQELKETSFLSRMAYVFTAPIMAASAGWVCQAFFIAEPSYAVLASMLAHFLINCLVKLSNGRIGFASFSSPDTRKLVEKWDVLFSKWASLTDKSGQTGLRTKTDIEGILDGLTTQLQADLQSIVDSGDIDDIIPFIHYIDKGHSSVFGATNVLKPEYGVSIRIMMADFLGRAIMRTKDTEYRDKLYEALDALSREAIDMAENLPTRYNPVEYMYLCRADALLHRKEYTEVIRLAKEHFFGIRALSRDPTVHFDTDQWRQKWIRNLAESYYATGDSEKARLLYDMLYHEPHTAQYEKAPIAALLADLYKLNASTIDNRTFRYLVQRLTTARKQLLPFEISDCTADGIQAKKKAVEALDDDSRRLLKEIEKYLFRYLSIASTRLTPEECIQLLTHAEIEGSTPADVADKAEAKRGEYIARMHENLESLVAEIETLGLEWENFPAQKLGLYRAQCLLAYTHGWTEKIVAAYEKAETLLTSLENKLGTTKMDTAIIDSCRLLFNYILNERDIAGTERGYQMLLRELSARAKDDRHLRIVYANLFIDFVVVLYDYANTKTGDGPAADQARELEYRTKAIDEIITFANVIGSDDLAETIRADLSSNPIYTIPFATNAYTVDDFTQLLEHIIFSPSMWKGATAHGMRYITRLYLGLRKRSENAIAYNLGNGLAATAPADINEEFVDKLCAITDALYEYMPANASLMMQRTILKLNNPLVTKRCSDYIVRKSQENLRKAKDNVWDIQDIDFFMNLVQDSPVGTYGAMPDRDDTSEISSIKELYYSWYEFVSMKYIGNIDAYFNAHNRSPEELFKMLDDDRKICAFRVTDSDRNISNIEAFRWAAVLLQTYMRLTLFEFKHDEFVDDLRGFFETFMDRYQPSLRAVMDANTLQYVCLSSLTKIKQLMQDRGIPLSQTDGSNTSVSWLVYDINKAANELLKELAPVLRKHRLPFPNDGQDAMSMPDIIALLEIIRTQPAFQAVDPGMQKSIIDMLDVCQAINDVLAHSPLPTWTFLKAKYRIKRNILDQYDFLNIMGQLAQYAGMDSVAESMYRRIAAVFVQAPDGDSLEQRPDRIKTLVYHGLSLLAQFKDRDYPAKYAEAVLLFERWADAVNGYLDSIEASGDPVASRNILSAIYNSIYFYEVPPGFFSQIANHNSTVNAAVRRFAKTLLADNGFDKSPEEIVSVTMIAYIVGDDATFETGAKMIAEREETSLNNFAPLMILQNAISYFLQNNRPDEARAFSERYKAFIAHSQGLIDKQPVLASWMEGQFALLNGDLDEAAQAFDRESEAAQATFDGRTFSVILHQALITDVMGKRESALKIVAATLEAASIKLSHLAGSALHEHELNLRYGNALDLLLLPRQYTERAVDLISDVVFGNEPVSLSPEAREAGLWLLSTVVDEQASLKLIGRVRSILEKMSLVKKDRDKKAAFAEAYDKDTEALITFGLESPIALKAVFIYYLHFLLNYLAEAKVKAVKDGACQTGIPDVMAGVDYFNNQGNYEAALDLIARFMRERRERVRIKRTEDSDIRELERIKNGQEELIRLRQTIPVLYANGKYLELIPLCEIYLKRVPGDDVIKNISANAPSCIRAANMIQAGDIEQAKSTLLAAPIQDETVRQNTEGLARCINAAEVALALLQGKKHLTARETIVNSVGGTVKRPICGITVTIENPYFYDMVSTINAMQTRIDGIGNAVRESEDIKAVYDNMQEMLSYPDAKDQAFRTLLMKGIEEFNAIGTSNESQIENRWGTREQAFMFVRDIGRLVLEFKEHNPDSRYYRHAQGLISQAMANYWMPELEDYAYLTHMMAEAEHIRDVNENKMGLTELIYASCSVNPNGITLTGVTLPSRGGRRGDYIRNMRKFCRVGDTCIVTSHRERIPQYFVVSSFDNNSITFELPPQTDDYKTIIRELKASLAHGGSIKRVKDFSWQLQSDMINGPNGTLRSLKRTAVSRIDVGNFDKLSIKLAYLRSQPQDKSRKDQAAVSSMLDRAMGLYYDAPSVKTRDEQTARQTYMRNMSDELAIIEEALGWTLSPEQKNGIMTALDYDIPFAVFHGPPGTGKTTEILIMLLVLVQLKKNPVVALLSQTNPGVDNIIERLETMFTRELKADLLTTRGRSKDSLEAKTFITRVGNSPAKIKPAVQKKHWADKKQFLREAESLATGIRSRIQSALYGGTIVGGINDVDLKNCSRLLQALMVIVDESSRATIPENMLGLLNFGRSARMARLVGDPDQLPPYGISKADILSAIGDIYLNGRIPLSTRDEEYTGLVTGKGQKIRYEPFTDNPLPHQNRTLGDILAKHSIDRLKVSLLEKAITLHRDDDPSIFKETALHYHFFDEQRRAGTDLVKSVNYHYNGKLIPKNNYAGVLIEDDYSGIQNKDYTEKDLKEDGGDTTGFVNRGEANRVISWVNWLINHERVKAEDIRIISPYGQQVELIQRGLVTFATIGARLTSLSNKVRVDSREFDKLTSLLLCKQPDSSDPDCFVSIRIRDFAASGHNGITPERWSALVRRLKEAKQDIEASSQIAEEMMKILKLGKTFVNVDEIESGTLRVMTVDSAIGDERRAVITSWVRSNDKGRVGFLADPIEGKRRRCVGDSRAQVYQIHVRNLSTFRNASPAVRGEEENAAEVRRWADHARLSYEKSAYRAMLIRAFKRNPNQRPTPYENSLNLAPLLPPDVETEPQLSSRLAWAGMGVSLLAGLPWLIAKTGLYYGGIAALLITTGSFLIGYGIHELGHVIAKDKIKEIEHDRRAGPLASAGLLVAALAAALMVAAVSPALSEPIFNIKISGILIIASLNYAFHIFADDKAITYTRLYKILAWIVTPYSPKKTETTSEPFADIKASTLDRQTDFEKLLAGYHTLARTTRAAIGLAPATTQSALVDMAGYREIHSTIIPERGTVGAEEQLANCLAQIDRIRREYARTLQVPSENIVIAKQDVFVHANDNTEFLDIKRAFATPLSAMAPTTFIGEPPDDHNSITMECIFTIPMPDVTLEPKIKKVIYNGRPYFMRYNVMTANGIKRIYAGSLTTDSYASSMKEQSEGAFELMKAILTDEGMTFDDIVRQWNYLERITDKEGPEQRYQIFNNVRGVYYSSAPVNGFPAATGIGTDHGGVVCEFFAVKTGRPRSEVGTVPMTNPLQIDAHAYSKRSLVGTATSTPKFERAKAFVADGHAQIFISGTASIRGEETVGIGDAEEQTRITLENIAALISRENLEYHGIGVDADAVTLKNVSQLRVYVKYAKDLLSIQKVCQKMCPGIPIQYVIADVCRENLLVEIEGIAGAPAHMKPTVDASKEELACTESCIKTFGLNEVQPVPAPDLLGFGLATLSPEKTKEQYHNIRVAFDIPAEADLAGSTVSVVSYIKTPLALILRRRDSQVIIRTLTEYYRDDSVNRDLLNTLQAGIFRRYPDAVRLEDRAVRTSIAVRTFTHGPATEILGYLTIAMEEAEFPDYRGPHTKALTEILNELISPTRELHREVCALTKAENKLPDIQTIIGWTVRMNSIRGMIEDTADDLDALKEKYPSMPIAQFARIKELISMMARSLDNRIRFAKGEAARDTIDITRLVESTIRVLPDYKVMKFDGPDKDVQIRILADGMTIEGDTLSLMNALANIIRNCREFSMRRLTDDEEAGRLNPEKPLVTVEVRRNGNEAEISVKDNGPGIAAEDLENIWKFNWTKNSGSTASGLGLSETDFVVKDMNGRREVRSEPGKGSEFILRLPVIETKDVRGPCASKLTIRKSLFESMHPDDRNDLIQVLSADKDMLLEMIAASDGRITLGMINNLKQSPYYDTSLEGRTVYIQLRQPIIVDGRTLWKLRIKGSIPRLKQGSDTEVRGYKGKGFVHGKQFLDADNNLCSIVVDDGRTIISGGYPAGTMSEKEIETEFDAMMRFSGIDDRLDVPIGKGIYDDFSFAFQSGSNKVGYIIAGMEGHDIRLNTVPPHQDNGHLIVPQYYSHPAGFDTSNQWGCLPFAGEDNSTEKDIFKQLGALVRSYHDRGLEHRMLSLGNIGIKDPYGNLDKLSAFMTNPPVMLKDLSTTTKIPYNAPAYVRASHRLLDLYRVIHDLLRDGADEYGDRPFSYLVRHFLTGYFPEIDVNGPEFMSLYEQCMDEENGLLAGNTYFYDEQTGKARPTKTGMLIPVHQDPHFSNIMKQLIKIEENAKPAENAKPDYPIMETLSVGKSVKPRVLLCIPTDLELAIRVGVAIAAENYNKKHPGTIGVELMKNAGGLTANRQQALTIARSRGADTSILMTLESALLVMKPGNIKK